MASLARQGVSVKRIVWTVGMGLAGFALGWQDQGAKYEPRHVLTVAACFAAIGLVLGTVFSRRRL
jgi:hypothetical protein